MSHKGAKPMARTVQGMENWITSGEHAGARADNAKRFRAFHDAHKDDKKGVEHLNFTWLDLRFSISIASDQ